MKKITLKDVTRFGYLSLRNLHLFRIRCRKNSLPMASGYLSYVTLLSLVPLVAVSFSLMSAFPVFQSFRESVETFVFSNFVPNSGEQIQVHLSGFVDNVSKMGTVGVMALMVVALLLISSIETTINRIFAVKEKRQLVIKFSIYWMILTLGPIVMGASLGVTSYLVSLAVEAEEYTLGVSGFFIKLLPFIISAFGFFMLYMLVPNKEIRWQSAIFGAGFAAVLFEISKKLFALYVTNFPSYQVIYGALAAIPILFVWVYLSWFVVLLGAELTVFIEEREYKLSLEADET